MYIFYSSYLLPAVHNFMDVVYLGLRNFVAYLGLRNFLVPK